MPKHTLSMCLPLPCNCWIYNAQPGQLANSCWKSDYWKELTASVPCYIQFLILNIGCTPDNFDISDESVRVNWVSKLYLYSWPTLDLEQRVPGEGCWASPPPYSGRVKNKWFWKMYKNWKKNWSTSFSPPSPIVKHNFKICMFSCQIERKLSSACALVRVTHVSIQSWLCAAA